MANDKRWCMAWFEGKAAGAGQTRAALQKDSKWRWRERDHDCVSWRRRRVEEARARHGEPLGGARDGQPAAGVQRRARRRRADFVRCRRWVMVHRRHDVPQSPSREQRMNFGWINANSSEEELRSVVLHEFGHALGLIREHQNPVAGIQWNREAVIRELSGPPNSWSVEEIEFNVLDPAAPEEVDATAMDKQSIMMYPIPASWTKDGFSAGFNSDLSTKELEVHPRSVQVKEPAARA